MCVCVSEREIHTQRNGGKGGRKKRVGRVRELMHFKKEIQFTLI